MDRGLGLDRREALWAIRGLAAAAPLPLFAAAAARGEGIAMARRSIVGEDLERGALRRLFDVSLKSPYAYWFVSPKDAAAMPKVKAFRDWVKQELA